MNNSLFFQYVVNAVCLASGTNTGNLVFATDSDFEFCHIASQSTGSFTYLITDNGTGRNLANAAVPNSIINAANFLGLPLTCGRYMVVPAGSIWTVLFQDTSVAGNTINLVLSGFKMQRGIIA